jgi:hypothetical protein
MSYFNTYYSGVLHENTSKTTISTGLYICINAENTGIVINELQKSFGIKVVDGGLIELDHHADEQIVKTLASLVKYGVVKKYTNATYTHNKTYHTSVLSKSQLLQKMCNLKI